MITFSGKVLILAVMAHDGLGSKSTLVECILKALGLFFFFSNLIDRTSLLNFTKSRPSDLTNETNKPSASKSQRPT